MLSCVSAASLSVDEVGYGSSAVVNHTLDNGYKIPGYVKVNGKNSTSPSFLNTLTKTVVQVNQNVKTPVTISSVGAAPSPSGSATGNLSKSEYITIAGNVKSFISSNGRAPNYASSSKGNIRYESLVYFYAKIMRYYQTNGKLPSTMNVLNIQGTTGGVNIDTTRPTVTSVDPPNNKIINVANKALVITFSENIKAGGAFSSIKVTNPDGVKVNPLYKVINGKTLTLTRNGYYINGLTYTITLPTGSITDAAGNAINTFTSKFTVDFVKPTVTSVDPANNKIINVANKAIVITFSENIKAGSAFTSIKVTNADGVSVDPLYKVINGKTLTLTRNGNYINGLTYTITLPTGSITDTAGNTLTTAFTSKFTIDTTKPTVTANLATGVYNTTKSVTLTATDNVDSNPAIYYTTNGSNPTTSSTRYTAPITISSTTTLKFMARDVAGNVAAVQTRTYTIDKTPPTVTANLATGVYNTTKSVTLTAIDNVDSNPAIYYTIDGSTPTTSSTRYTTPITISGTTTLKFMARDNVGNVAAVQTRNYIIDTPPTVTANPRSGVYNLSQTVTLTATDNSDPNPVIYYTLNGGNPTTSSTRYTAPITISSTTTLKFVPVDNRGNQGDVVTEHYIFAPVGNINTGKAYTSIRAAVDDPLTVDDQTIQVLTGNYNENIVVNKRLNIMAVPGNKVIIRNTLVNEPIFTVTADGSGSTIQGLTLNFYFDRFGDHADLSPYALFLYQADYCTINGNAISTNENLGNSGIYLSNSGNNEILGNTVTNCGNGIDIVNTSNLNTVSGNNISGNGNGVKIGSSSKNTITQNNITNNQHGISLTNTYHDVISENTVLNSAKNGVYLRLSDSDFVKFNRITGSGEHGLFAIESNDFGVDLTHNWWGTNTPHVSSSKGSDIYIQGSGVLYDPWLELIAIPTSYKVSGGKTYETTITADLTRNNYGDDTSLDGHVPDGTPVNFSTNKGTITTIGHTKNGKTTSKLVLDPNLQSGMTTVSTRVDRQNISNSIDRVANANITVLSTAIDTSTNKTLNFNYTLPLNTSTAWVSVLWKATGMFKGEVDLIVNGNKVSSKNVVNKAYLTYKSSYTANVFTQISYINELFLTPLANNIPLYTILKNETGFSDAQIAALTDSQQEAYVLNWVKKSKNLTNNDINFIKAHRWDFIDPIEVVIIYPSDFAQQVSLIDPFNNNILEESFGGSPIVRISPMVYLDGYGKEGDVGYEGVRSFAIATTKVTDTIVQDWLKKASSYPAGAMRAAYGTFLASLLLIKAHDMVADQAAAEFNVSWSRTTPIMVSVVDDAYETVLTLQCDHGMGMTVTGDPSSVWAFRFACSSAISPLEEQVLSSIIQGSIGLSVTSFLGQLILNGGSPEVFMSNGYVVFKVKGIDDFVLMLDPATGIVRDVMTSSVYGVYCFHDQLTTNTIQLAGKLNSTDPNVQPVWLGIIGSIATGAASAEAVGTGSAFVGGTGTGVFGLGVGTALLYGGAFIGVSIGVAAMLYEPYLVLYVLPEKLRIMKEIHDAEVNQTPLWIGTVSLFLPDDRAPTPEEMQEAQEKATYLLLMMAENSDTELTNKIIELGESYLATGWTNEELESVIKNKEKFERYTASGPKPLGWDQIFAKFVEVTQSGVSKLVSGDIIGGSIDLAHGLAGISFVTGYTIYESWPEGVWPK